ncbi:SDR family NAD(P)-dependent oxidoreductase [Methylocystis heyeri]|uniref:SDR family NAD(P)-dependent oxidoreductase n=1 Tax=Methylocystis heyeri TaxID=391905 RepID=A0A6B8KDT3_9HYPH|nr:SDR family oxidoreductase [Methylocystis heyeri]QGM44580.1 SDR family NAD(P)-dependent oxidoreductase [Methylocystis heyeri]
MNDLAVGRTKATIVTGASEGIGAELARIFAAKGHEVVLVARRRDRLEALAAEIASTGGKAHVIELDLCGEGAIDALEVALRQAGLTPEILVNNAGFGLIGPASKLDEAEQLHMVELNVKALSALTLRFMKPIMEAKGGILNVASIASFMPGPNFAVYYATKAYVRSFSEAIAQELAPLGVKVSCLCPGPVLTGFQARAGFDLTGAMAALKPSLVSAEEVARQGYEGLFAGRRVVVPGVMNKFTVAFARLTPRAVLMPILAFAQNGRT